MANISQRIRETALALLEANPNGLRYSELIRQVLEKDASYKENTVMGTVWNLDEQFPDQIYKPSRGLYRLTKYRAEGTDQLKDELVPKPPPKFRGRKTSMHHSPIG